MEYNKNVYKMYLTIFFHNLIPAYVIERLFYEQRGITVFMVVLMEMIYAATIVLLEIPSGILADKIGRKRLLIAGAFLAFLEFGILLFARGFTAFAITAVIAGVASSCTSGAFNALLYDSMHEAGREENFEKVLGRINSLDFTAALLAALSGSVFAKFYGFELNYILSTVSMFLALLFTISLIEPPRGVLDDEKLEGKEGFTQYFKKALTFFRNKPQLAFLLIDAMAIGACVSYLDEFWQLYLNHIGFSILFFGVFSASISVIRIPGNLMAAYLLKFFAEKSILAFVLAICSIGFFITYLFPGPIGVAAIFMIFLVSGVVEPIITGYLHRHASSDIRATIDSFQSLCKKGIIFGIGLAFGYIASMSSVSTGFAFLGLVCSVFLTLLLVNRRKSRTAE